MSDQPLRSDRSTDQEHSGSTFGRRRLLGGAAALAGSAALGGGSSVVRAAEHERKGSPIRRGRITQSVANWCFQAMGPEWSTDKLCGVAARLGIRSVELAPPEDWPTLKKHGLVCAVAPNGMPAPPFVKGLNNPKFHEQVADVTSETIDACAEAGMPSVIAFTGYRWRDPNDPSSGEIPRDEAIENCVEGFKRFIGRAEKKKVNVVLEILNSRVTDHPMKGHPGYQGDDVEFCTEVIDRVGSDRLKLLFDVYHVQIMQGDLITRIGQYADYIGHVHTAGNPGRNELDETQEINYPPIMRKLLEVGYDGYVGQEFIPTRDPVRSLAQAAAICDV